MFIIKSKSGKFFAGETVGEEGHIEEHWVADQRDSSVRVFGRKDAAENAADFFGGEVIEEV